MWNDYPGHVISVFLIRCISRSTWKDNQKILSWMLVLMGHLNEVLEGQFLRCDEERRFPDICVDRKDGRYGWKIEVCRNQSKHMGRLHD